MTTRDLVSRCRDQVGERGWEVEGECSRLLEQRFASQAFGAIYQDSGSAWSRKKDPDRALVKLWGAGPAGGLGTASSPFRMEYTYVGSSGGCRVSTEKDVQWPTGRQAWLAFVEAADKSGALSPRSIGTEWRVPDSRARSREIN